MSEVTTARTDACCQRSPCPHYTVCPFPPRLPKGEPPHSRQPLSVPFEFVEGVARNRGVLVHASALAAWADQLLRDADGVSGPVMRPISDKEIEQIAGRDELTGDAILDFAHRLLTAAANPDGVRCDLL
jgi:hypothetical protein